jgi:RNA polymerase sigma factor (sigma-70 family)
MLAPICIVRHGLRERIIPVVGVQKASANNAIARGRHRRVNKPAHSAHRMEEMPRAEVDVEALETLYRAHLSSYVRAAVAIVGDDAAGRDAVQEAFVHAIRKRASFREEAPLEAWVWRIVINEARALRRRRRTRALESDTEHLSAGSTNGAAEEDGEVRAWIAALPERQRLVVFLRYFADLDYGSIAAVLDVEVGTVSATLAAAHGALRRSCQEVVR